MDIPHQRTTCLVFKLGNHPEGLWIWVQEGLSGMSVAGDQLHRASLVYYCPLLLYFTVFSIIKLFLFQHTSFTLTLVPILPGQGAKRGKLNKWLWGVSSPAGHKTTTHVFEYVILNRNWNYISKVCKRSGAASSKPVLPEPISTEGS